MCNQNDRGAASSNNDEAVALAVFFYNSYAGWNSNKKLIERDILQQRIEINKAAVDGAAVGDSKRT